MDPTPPANAPTNGPKSSADRNTMDSPILKKPSVDGTYIEKIIVAIHTNAVKILAKAIVNGASLVLLTIFSHQTGSTQIEPDHQCVYSLHPYLPTRRSAGVVNDVRSYITMQLWMGSNI